MSQRFDRAEQSGAVSAGAREGGQSTAVRERRPVAPSAEAGTSVREARQREHDRFGGFSWGSDFFGWLTAAGLTAILTGLASAAGVAVALNEVGQRVTGGEARTIGLIGAIVLLAVLAIAYYCGGYVAGRMARFDGARQGIGVWLVGIIIALVLAGLAAVAGSQFNVLQSLNMPQLPLSPASYSTEGLIAGIAALLVSLLAAIAGGKAGERFHRKVDAVGLGA